MCCDLIVGRRMKRLLECRDNRVDEVNDAGVIEVR